MKSNKIFLLFLAFFTINTVWSQTVVKMDLPQHAEQPLNVVALFNEELPEGIPVVLGLMGYYVEGGIAPYFFEWMLNGEVISTSDLAIFTPKKGDDLSLKVTDNNKCRASSSFNLKVARMEQNPEEEDKSIKIYPTVFTQDISIQFSEKEYEKAMVRIFNTNGILVYQIYLPESTRLPLNLNPGVYFISVKTGDLHKVEKIIAQ